MLGLKVNTAYYNIFVVLVLVTITTLMQGITLLTKEIAPKNIFCRNEIQYRDDMPTKRKVVM